MSSFPAPPKKHLPLLKCGVFKVFTTVCAFLVCAYWTERTCHRDPCRFPESLQAPVLPFFQSLLFPIVHDFSLAHYTFPFPDTRDPFLLFFPPTFFPESFLRSDTILRSFPFIPPF